MYYFQYLSGMVYGTKVTTIVGSKNVEIYFKKYGGTTGVSVRGLMLHMKKAEVQAHYWSGNLK